MNEVFTVVLEQINKGLMLGIVIGALLLCYPLLKNVFSAQQRVWLWLIACLGWGIKESKLTLCDVSFQDLITPRTGRFFHNVPAFLPGAYTGPGDYHIALPGGELLRVGFHDWMLLLLSAVWIGGMVVLGIHFWRSSKRVLEVGRQGVLLQEGDPCLKALKLHPLFSENTKVYISSGLPTSFVHCCMPFALGEYEVFLQKELSPEQMELVLLHEGRHIGLLHSFWKCWATVTLVWYWWNPLVWLGFRYFCRDIELACDDSVMKKLKPEQRKEYAKTLVELGTGRQLWEAPLAFGESDSALRVRHLVKWKKRPWLLSIPLWIVMFTLALFMRGGNIKLQSVDDMLLTWEREKGGVAAFVQDLEREMAEDFAKDSEMEYWQACDVIEAGLHVTEVWEAPVVYRKNSFSGEDTPHTALWVQEGPGRWYHIRYTWWGGDSSFIGVLDVKETVQPDLTGCRRLA